MSRLEDVIKTDDYGKIHIFSQDEMEYFFQDKEYSDALERSK